MAESIGAIALSLTLDYGEFRRQLSDISGQAGKILQDGFKGASVDVGKGIANAMDTKPIDTFQQAVKGAQSDLADVGKEIQKQDGSEIKIFIMGQDVNALEGTKSKVEAIKESAQEASDAVRTIGQATSPLAGIADVDGLSELKRTLQNVKTESSTAGQQMAQAFRAPEAPLDLLNTKLDNIYSQMGQTEAKIADVTAEYNKFGDTDLSSPEAVKLEEQLTRLQSKLISLQGQANNTATQIDKMGSASERSGLQKMGTSSAKAAKGVRNIAIAAPSAAKNIKSVGQEAEGSGKKMDQAGRHASKFGTRLRSIVAGAFVFNVISQGLTKLRQFLGGALKTNEQFASSLAQIKGNLLIAFQPIYNAILPAINTLASALAKASAVVAAFFSTLFGTTVKSSASAAESLYNTTQGVTGVGNAAQSAGKKIKGMLAPFDELNVLEQQESDSGSDGSSGGGGSIAPDFSAVTTFDTSGVESMANKVKEVLGNLVDKISGWWKDLEPTREAFKNLWNALVPFAGAIGGGLLAFMEDLVGWCIDFSNENIAPKVEDLADAIEEIDPQTLHNIGYGLGVVLTGILGFKAISKVVGWVTSAAKKIESAFTAIKTVGASVIAFIKGINFTTLFGSWSGGNALVVLLADKVNEATEWIYDNSPAWLKKILDHIFWVLPGVMLGVPFGPIGMALGGLFGMILSNLPGVLENNAIQFQDSVKQFLSDSFKAIFNWDTALELLDAAGQCFKEAFSGDKTWWEIGANILKGIGLGILGAFQFLVEPIQDFFDWIWKQICKVFGIQSPSTEMEPIGANILLGIIEGFKGKFGEWWDSLWSWASETWKKAKEWAGETWDGIKEKFPNVPEWFGEKFGAAREKVEEVWKNVSGWFSDRWDDICGAFDGAPGWFEDTFGISWEGVKEAFSLENIKTFFGDIWSGIKETFASIPDWFEEKFSDAWETVKDVFSADGETFEGIKEGISETFKTVVNHIISGLNMVIAFPFNKINGMLNKIRATNILGFEPFKNLWGYNPLPIPQIPKLARGGLAYAPQLAMVGDNPNARSDPEVIAPLSKLKGMVGSGDVDTLTQALYNAFVQYFGDPAQRYEGDLVIRTENRAIGKIAIQEIINYLRANGALPFPV